MKKLFKNTKGLLLTLLLAMALPANASAACTGFTDVAETDACYESVLYLAEQGITNGTGADIFSPDAPMTVRQWCVMLCRAYDLPIKGDTWEEMSYNAMVEAYSHGWMYASIFSAPDTQMCRGALYTFFTMGGAKSHDIEDGILEPDAPDFARKLQMLQRKPRARYRIDHISWWKQELPSDEEYAEARKNLERCGWQIDYIITHCAPTSIALAGARHNEADCLTDFLQGVKEKAQYHYWLFGHYHDNRAIDERHILLWEQIVRII